MDHTHLTAEQYQPIIAHLVDHRDYLSKLIDRMTANQFPVDDPLFAAVSQAWQAASNACVVASTWRNKRRPAAPAPPLDTIMTRKPWAGQ
jgi:hypothetical protein